MDELPWIQPICSKRGKWNVGVEGVGGEGLVERGW